MVVARHATGSVSGRILLEGGALHADEWRLLADHTRPHGLIVGPAEFHAVLIEALSAAFRPPILRWPADGPPWETGRRVGTLLLHDVAVLAPRQQRQLLAWMDEAGREAQVIAFAAEPLYPLVRRRRFSPSLYYRLNRVYVVAV